MRKLLCIVLLALSTVAFVFAGAVAEQKTEIQANETRIFTDSLGRDIELPTSIERGAPSGNVAQLALYALAPEKMVGWSTRLSSSAMETFLPEIAELPVFGTFYGKKANLNREALIMANPDVVIDVGEIKGSVEAMAKQLDELSDSIGIPVVFVEGYLENTDTMFTRLGELLGKEKEASALAEFSRKALDTASSNSGAIAKSVYYSSSNDGLSAIETGSFHGEVIELIGAENIVPSTFSGSNGQASLEQIYLWNPDVILLSSEEAYNTVNTDSAWRELKAVQDKEVYLIPSSPYSFLDSPPATNRIIGIYWLGGILAPNVYTEDIVSMTEEYYELFYHKALTEEEAKAILYR